MMDNIFYTVLTIVFLCIAFVLIALGRWMWKETQ